jgi:hypothetical protein
MANALRVGICVGIAILLLLGKEVIFFAASALPIQNYLPTTQILWVPYLVTAVILFPLVAWGASLIVQIRGVRWVILIAGLYLAFFVLSLSTLEESSVLLLALNCLLSGAFLLAGLLFIRLKGKLS